MSSDTDKHGVNAVVPDEIQQTLYAKREKIYPRQVSGIFARLKILAGTVLLGLYYLVPWLRWDDHQMVLFNLPARKFHILGLTFWPQDFIYLALLLIIAGISLFFFTALAGRLWCGFSCPQTVWTDVFLWIERRVEGDRPQQIKLDKSPLSWRKTRIKLTKHSLWFVFSLFTGFTFVGYFTPIRELADGFMHFNMSGWETFWMIFYGFATYGNAGWMREQVCLYMCPYARFQSAMFDDNTMVIAYDKKRGEPRGSRKRGSDHKSKGLGDCISCTLCVQVCPTGIDIRNGLQYQCISCSACVDVCNEVMDKMGYAHGLIRYTTETALKGQKVQVVRPRVIIYAILLLALLTGLTYNIVTRLPLELDIIRDRKILYKETDEGMLLNVYNLRIINMDEAPHNYTLKATGLKDMKLEMVQKTEIKVDSSTTLDIPVRLMVDPANLPNRSNKVFFELTASDAPELHVREEARFLGPLKP